MVRVFKLNNNLKIGKFVYGYIGDSITRADMAQVLF